MRIYTRGKRGIYWFDISVDGQRVKRSAGTTDRRQAEEYAATFARDLWRTKRLGEVQRVTWDTAVLAWLQEYGHRKSIEDIKHRLRWLTQRLAGKPLTDISTDVIRKLAAERKAQAVGDSKQSSNATVNRHLAELSKILHYAHVRGWLAALPPIAKMHEPAKRVTWLTQEQARDLLDELPEHLRAMAAFSLSTGLRESNVRLLCWQQVDLNRRVAWVYADQAKAGKDLNVPLNDDAMAVLFSQLGKDKRWVFPVSKVDKELGIRVDGLPTGKISNHAWRKACIRAGFPTLRFHDLRHTWASWHVQAGTPLPVLQELGGWASLAMVQRYAHLAMSHVAAWASNIGTSSVQVEDRSAPNKQNYMGWLMGLEPTTTGITKCSQRGEVIRIKDLADPKKRKSA